MLYEHSIEHGRADIGAALVQLAPAVAALVARKNKQASALLDMPDDLGAIETLAADIRKRFGHVVVVGAGGSGLSGCTLVKLAPLAEASRFSFLENIDPETLSDVMRQIDFKKTCFLIISKSGGTLETLSQFFVLAESAKNKLGAAMGEHFVVITEATDNPLRQAAAEHKMKILDHHPHIGGRFAILTAVGLLPAAIAGLDIRALRKGAKSVADGLSAESPPAIGAALQYSAIQKNHPMTVLFSYAEKLSGFGAWWRQCWAESLGKSGKGSTPVPAIGTTDQHSQLQLYLDGPRDKLFTLILLKRAGSGPKISSGQDFLRGKTLGDVMEAEQQATLATLIRRNCPLRLFRLELLSEAALGALLMHAMIEILLTAHLLGVDPFGQPAVEEGKILALNYLKTGKP